MLRQPGDRLADPPLLVADEEVVLGARCRVPGTRLSGPGALLRGADSRFAALVTPVVQRDLIQERREARAGLVAVASQPETQEYLLGAVLGLFPVAEEAVEKRLEARAMAPAELREGIDVTLAGTAHQPQVLLVGGCQPVRFMRHDR